MAVLALDTGRRMISAYIYIRHECMTPFLQTRMRAGS